MVHMRNAYLGVFQRWLDRRYAGRSNVELLRAYAAERDEAAFVALVARYAEFVYGVCLRGTRQRPLAEEAFQQTFAELARHASRIRGQDALGAWLRTTARRIAWRMRWRERVHSYRHATRPVRAVTAEGTRTGDQLIELLNQLPEAYAEPLRLHYLGERTVKEVSRDLGISEAAARKRIERGLEHLRRVARPEVLAALGAAGLPAAARALAPELVRELAQAALREAAVRPWTWSSWLLLPNLAPRAPLLAVLLVLGGLGALYVAGDGPRPAPRAMIRAESLQAKNLRVFQDEVLPELLRVLQKGSLGDGHVRLTSLEAVDTRIFCSVEVTHFPRQPWSFRTNLVFNHNLFNHQTHLLADDLGNERYHPVRLDKAVILLRSKELGVEWSLDLAALRQAVATFTLLPEDVRTNEIALRHLEEARAFAQRFVGTWYVRGERKETRTIRIVEDFLHLMKGKDVFRFSFIPEWKLSPDNATDLGMTLDPQTGHLMFTTGEWWSREPSSK